MFAPSLQVLFVQCAELGQERLKRRKPRTRVDSSHDVQQDLVVLLGDYVSDDRSGFVCHYKTHDVTGTRAIGPARTE